MTTKEVDALVLKSEEYKEKDALVTYLVEDQIVRVYARGIQAMKSKNRALCQPFSYVHITLDERTNRFPLLLYGNVKQFYFHINEDLMVQSCLLVLNDLVKFSPLDASFFDLIKTTWHSFHQRKNGYSYACLCLKEIIEAQGIAPYVDGCVHCGRTNRIETISMRSGGFLCSMCNHGHKKSKEALVQIHGLFHVGRKDYGAFVSRFVCTESDFIYWSQWIEYHLNLSLPSLRFLTSISTETVLYY